MLQPQATNLRLEKEHYVGQKGRPPDVVHLPLAVEHSLEGEEAELVRRILALWMPSTKQ